MKMKKRVIAAFIALLLVTGLMPVISLPVTAVALTPDCYITFDGTNYHLSLSAGGAATVSDTSLETVLSACTDTNGDGLVIQLGSAETPLVVNGVDTPLVSATYTGSVTIACSEKDRSVVLYVPYDKTVTFSGLCAGMKSDAYGCNLVKVNSGGTLNVQGGSSLSMPLSNSFGTCINNEGTLNIDGATVYGYYYGIYTTGTLNISETDPDTKTLISGGSFGVYTYGSTVNMSGGNIAPASASLPQQFGLSASGGTVNISGGSSISCNNGGIAIMWSGKSSDVMTIDGSAKVATSDANSSAISTSGSSKLIIGGNAEISATEKAYAAVSNQGVLEIKDHASVIGTTFAVGNSSGGTVNMSGGSISATKGNTLENSGTVGITGGTVSNACKSEGYSTVTSAINNKAGGSVTIDGPDAVVKHTAVSYFADYGIRNEGALSIKNGAVSCAAAVYDSAAVGNFGAGTVSITGGSITATGTSGIAVSEDFAATGLITVSGAPIITSNSEYTIVYKYHSPETAAINYFGKTYYTGNITNITITGAADGSNHHVINSVNYGSASLNTQIMDPNYGFIAWTSDAGKTDYLSTTDGVAISSLSSAKDPSFTAVYLLVKELPSAPTEDEAFTDSDKAPDKVGGNITWKAPSNIGDIDGYKIYWGSSESTVLSGSSIIDTVGKDASSYSIANGTALLENAAFFLIYSHNSVGNSKNCLAVPIVDDYSPFAISGTVSKGTSALTDLSGITVTLYSSGKRTGYTAVTDKSGAYQIKDVVKGKFTAVVNAVPDSYAKSESAEFYANADYSGADVSLSDPVNVGYPYFVITKGAAETEYYYVYEKETHSGSFVPFCNEADASEENGQNTAYSKVSDAIVEICDVVSDGFATLYFGKTGTNPNNLSGMLDTNEDRIYLDTTGTYVIKGGLEGSNVKKGLIILKKASLIVDGAKINSINTDTISSSGGGSITINSGEVSCSTKSADDDPVSAINTTKNNGDIIISGGSVFSDSDSAIYNNGTGCVLISGKDTKVASANMPAVLSQTVKISGGTVSGKMAAIYCSSADISGGNIECSNGPALACIGGSSTVSGGTLTSTNTATTMDMDSQSMPGTVFCCDQGEESKLVVGGGTIKNDGDSGYAIYNFEDSDYSRLYLSGTPVISGPTDIFSNTVTYADDGTSSPKAYDGDALTLFYGSNIEPDGSTLAVSSVISGTNSNLFSIVNDGYYLKLNGNDLLIAVSSGTVTFDYNYKGAAKPYAKYPAGDEDKVAKPKDPILSGYTFGGWFTDEACTTAFDFSTKISGAKTLFAKWTASDASVPYGVYPSVSVEGTSLGVGVGGVEQKIGKLATFTDSSGAKTATVTADEKELQNYISQAANGSSVVFTVPQNTGASQSRVELTAQTVDELSDRGMSFTVQSGDVTLDFPSSAIDTDSIGKALSASGQLDRITLTVSVSPASADVAEILKKAASSGGFETLGSPVSFTLTAAFGGNSLEIEQYSGYVSRTLELDKATDPKKITTAISENPDGTIRHIPTYVYKGSDGKFYARINSLTNSAYALIYNDEAFADASGKWYETQAHEMASRKILTGYKDGVFGGDSAITRAEFAAIIVRALGLPESGGSKFGDVASSAWYNGYVGTASEYGIIKGRSAAEFDPDSSITREEAMAMIARAASVSGYKGTDANIGAYSDLNKISSWAKDAVSFNLKNGLIVGSDAIIRPNASITRAETATVVLRLFQKAGLVDIRSKV